MRDKTQTINSHLDLLDHFSKNRPIERAKESTLKLLKLKKDLRRKYKNQHFEATDADHTASSESYLEYSTDSMDRRKQDRRSPLTPLGPTAVTSMPLFHGGMDRKSYAEDYVADDEEDEDQHAQCQHGEHVGGVHAQNDCELRRDSISPMSLIRNLTNKRRHGNDLLAYYLQNRNINKETLREQNGGDALLPRDSRQYGTF